MNGLSPYIHASAMVLVALVFAAFTAAALIEVDIIAEARGRVVPTTAVRPVDTEIGGRIISVLAKQGDLVDEDQPILLLDSTVQIAEVGRLTQQVRRARLAQARALSALETLSASQDESDISFSEAGRIHDEKIGDLDVDGSSRIALMAELASFASQLGEINLEISLARSSSDLTQAKEQRAKAILTIEQANFEISNKLYKSGTISNSEFLKRSQPYENALGDLKIVEKEILQKDIEMNALNQRRHSKILETKYRWQREFEESKSNIEEIELLLLVAKHNLELTSVRSPTRGRISEFLVRAVGAQVKPRQTIANVVPIDDNIQIEAFLSSSEAAFVYTGQVVQINLDAYPSIRYGKFTGHIKTVSADTNLQPNGRWTYSLVVVPDNTEISSIEGVVKLMPGMTMTVRVTTGKRTIFEYFFEPVFRSFSESLSER